MKGAGYLWQDHNPSRTPWEVIAHTILLLIFFFVPVVSAASGVFVHDIFEQVLFAIRCNGCMPSMCCL